jgi:tetraacyldisaccharide 4'-kinase
LNPLSAFYAAVVAGKNRLYDSGVLTAHRLQGPVISIGNLSVGGSGKTPFVILLGQLLQERGVAVDVLTRGYGRKTRGVLEVDPSGSPEQFGDEPLLIARRLGCSVVVGESRYEAGLCAEKIYGTRLHILDDGFQHRALARDFDIVFLTSEDLGDQTLPAGRLREPLASLRRADAVVITGEIDYALPPGKAVWRIRRGLELSETPARPVVFCGIARPERFITQLGDAGVEPVATKFYRDHHRYDAADIGDLRALRHRSGATGFITTEKDAINLGQEIGALASLSIARVRMELERPADALDTILRVIRDRKPAA